MEEVAEKTDPLVTFASTHNWYFKSIYAVPLAPSEFYLEPR